MTFNYVYICVANSNISVDWIQKIKTNENEALKEIYMLCREDCLVWLQKDFGCTQDDALDIFQMSVIILYDNVMKGKLTTISSNIKTYLFGIAKNKALELCRDKKNIATDDISLIVNYVVQDNEENLLEHQISTALIALDQLGDPCKSVLQLYYYHDKSMEEITEKMGYKNVDTTKNQKYKCLKRLQNIYSGHILKSGKD